MDSLEVNKGIAAVLVGGIIFFLTGMIADGLVHQKPLEKTAIAISGAPEEEAASTQGKPEEIPPIAPLLAKADVQAGEKFAHKVCTSCHTFDEGGKAGTGPNLYNVVGGPHDHMQGFKYSDALQKFKDQPWTYDDLNHWLLKPRVYAPGTRMTFAGIPNAQLRADVIAYLRSLSHNPVPLPSPEEAAPAAPAGGAPAATTPGGTSAGGGNAAQPQKSPAAGSKPKPQPAGGAGSAAGKPGAPAATGTAPAASGAAPANTAPSSGAAAPPAASAALPPPAAPAPAAAPAK